MEKLRAIYKYALGINFAYVLVLGLMVKALVSYITYPTFLLTIPVLAFEGYKLFLKSKEPVPYIQDKALRDELDRLKTKVNAGTLDKNINQPTKRYF